MFCPNCGFRNSEEAKFCRSCGVTLALIPQALTGKLPDSSDGGSLKDDPDKKPPSFERGLRETLIGIGFIFASIAVFFFAPAGRLWFWSFLFPAFGGLAKGIPEMLAAQRLEQSNPHQMIHPPRHQANFPAIPPPPSAVDERARKTGEMNPQPPSVTENTTKLFDEPQN